ncbi:MAG: APC family permease [Legionellales bacterium]|nr:APC family permease [Legionellales bacterium]
MEFKRSIGTGALLMTAVGSMVGSGWLFGPLYVAKIAGPAAIIAWVLGGLMMMTIALTLAELSATYPVAGGLVKFSHMSHDSLVSFTIAWMAWLSSVAIPPIEVLAILQYSSNYIPGLVHPVNHTQVLSELGMLVAAGLLLVLVLINVLGAKLFARVGSVMGIIKLAAPIIVLIVFASIAMHWNNFHLQDGFLPFGWHGVVKSIPTAGVIFSFIGFTPAVQLAGEAKNPQRAVPLAVIGSLLICIFLYVALQFVFIAILPAGSLSAGWQNLTFAGANGPFVGIAAGLGLFWLSLLIYFSSVFSPLGTAFNYTASTGRMNYAMSENGYMPKWLQQLNSHHVPGKAIFMNYIVGLILLLPFPGWQSLVGFLVLTIVIAYITGPIALMSLRHQRPHEKRPFKLPCAALLTPLAFYICNLIVFWTGWYTFEKVMIALMIGYIYLFCYRKLFHASASPIYWHKSWWIFPYFIGMSVISYLGSFGNGLGKIPFGWDFLVIGLFSLIIFKLAVAVRANTEEQPSAVELAAAKNQLNHIH